jgi:hypothetical protein
MVTQTFSDGSPIPDAPPDEFAKPKLRLTYEERLEAERARADEDRAARLVSARSRLGTTVDIAGTLAAVKEGCRSWLVERLIVHGQYGVFAAESKVGKTTAMLDLAVAVAANKKWLGMHACPTTGPVLIFAGEGGAEALVQRLEAVANFHGVPVSALGTDKCPVHLVTDVPRIRDEVDMEALAEVVSGIQPVLVLLDPAYMVAGGVDSSQVTSMGVDLPKLQRAVSDQGATLIVVHHFNRSTGRTGAERISGAGWREWGRFNISAEVLPPGPEKQDDGRWRVDIKLNTEGGELPGEALVFRRWMWKEDPADLAAPLHYLVEPLNEAEATEALSLTGAERAILRALSDSAGWTTVTALADAAGLANATVQNALAAQVRKDKVRKLVGSGTGNGRRPHLYGLADLSAPLPDNYRPSEEAF